ncbi:MAG: type II secretion system protein [Fretibacterium sp.]|nr:type II secretion system protein [Fretibacterium sp.]
MRRRGFTLVEMILALVILGIVGVAIVTTFVSFYASYFQTEDYAIARMEIEEAFRFLTPRITNAGLGMPNNLSGEGTFVAAFAPPKKPPYSPEDTSLMGLMGDAFRVETKWGGPVTVTKGDLARPVFQANAVTSQVADGSYVGPELYYAWAEPTGVFLVPDINSLPSNTKASLEPPLDKSWGYEAFSQDKRFWSDRTDQQLLLAPTTGMSGADRLWAIFSADKPAQADSWMVFPSFGAPLLVKGFGTDNVRVQVAPNSFFDGFDDDEKVLVGGVLYGFEEVHRVRAARVRLREDGHLVHEIYDGTAEAPTATRVLARNVAAVCFQFYPETRLLRMHLAARGRETGERVPEGVPPSWPSVAPLDEYFTQDDRARRLVVESMTWRIRN